MASARCGDEQQIFIVLPTSFRPASPDPGQTMVEKMRKEFADYGLSFSIGRAWQSMAELDIDTAKRRNWTSQLCLAIFELRRHSMSMAIMANVSRHVNFFGGGQVSFDVFPILGSLATEFPGKSSQKQSSSEVWSVLRWGKRWVKHG